MARYLQGLTRERQEWNRKLALKPKDPQYVVSCLMPLLKIKLISLAVNKMFLVAATGVSEGKIRFDRFNGTILQWLLFRKGFERKEFPIALFRFVWGFITQKRFLMPLVRKKGIYCFFSREFADRLAGMIRGMRTIEIAAGDGTLSGFLREHGAEVTATDDRSWSHSIEFPDSVEDLAAGPALKKYAPEAVICSWPPSGNTFEKEVFRTPSVRLYIVVGSRHGYAFGDHKAYAEAVMDGAGFMREEDERLAKLVVPRELESAVLVFRRKTF